jgi:hypothetical protein
VPALPRAAALTAVALCVGVSVYDLVLPGSGEHDQLTGDAPPHNGSPPHGSAHPDTAPDTRWALILSHLFEPSSGLMKFLFCAEDSWVARWLHLGSLYPGCYAISVTTTPPNPPLIPNR